MYTFPKTVNGSDAIRLVVLDASPNVPTAVAMVVDSVDVSVNSFGEKGPTTLYLGVRLAI
tara:strand:- start:9366 stop:9545 length:180 start_codon:yes stop_codon:yes gene_type:complete